MFDQIKPHLFVVLGFVVLAFAYAAPVLKGEKLAQHDVVQAAALQEEPRTLREQTGEVSMWNSRVFSGMPGYLIYSPHEQSVTTYLGRWLNSLLPPPVNLIFLYLLGCYLLLVALGVDPWLGAVGAIGFAFASYHIVIIEAGHYSKCLALGFVPPLIAGVIVTYRGRYLTGIATTAFFLAMQLYANHVQITYYTFLALVIFGVIELVRAARAGRLPQFFTATALLVLVATIAVGTQASRLWSVYEYSKLTIRGPSELSAEQTDGGGLTRDYAFDYSNDVAETLTLLVPNFYGGASQGELSTSSNTYEALISNNVPRASATNFVARVPLYWGEQPFVAGPAYAGAVVLLLFVFGLFTLRHPLKWWAVGAAGLMLLFTLGKNLAWFNYLFFDYLPYFNKFRAHTMAVALLQLFVVLVGALAVRDVLTGQTPLAAARQGLLRAALVVGGLSLLLALLAGALFDFESPVDARMQLPDWALDAIRDDRKSLLQRDAFRSLLFVGLAAGLFYAFTLEKVGRVALLAGLGLLTLVDLWAIDRRYLSTDDFAPARQRSLEKSFPLTAADQRILQDTANFRVMDLTVSTFNDNRPAYYHRTIGGYHAAKLRRYQDLISYHISKRNRGVLNMLNTKYVIAPGEDGQPRVQTNPGALGNAWFVRNYRLVPNADAEIAALDSIDPATTAVVDERFANQLASLDLRYDPQASIQLTEFAPNRLVYRTRANSDQLAVFSEIYYNRYNDWRVLVDGEEADHLRANYVLRAMPIPAGEHEVEFRFYSQSYHTGSTVDLVCSVLLVLLVGGAIVSAVRRRQLPPAAVPPAHTGPDAVAVDTPAEVARRAADPDVAEGMPRRKNPPRRKRKK